MDYTHIQINDQNFYLIGTAHVSKVSAQQVKDIIDEIQPDSICIELDKKRYDSIQNPNRWEETNIIDIIKGKQVGYLLVSLILSSFQKRVATNLDSQSGQEMIIGINKSKENNSELVLVDRDIQMTFTRIWRKHSFGQKIKLLSSIALSIFEDEEISEQDLENLKQSDLLDAALSEVGKAFPVVKEVLVDERDKYLANKIRTATGKNVVCILGAAHLPGVLKTIYEPVDISEYEIAPKRSLLSKCSGYIIPIIIVGLIAYTIFHNSSLGFEQIKSWILYNGLFSAFGVLISGGHIFSILTAFIAAPITSLNPLLAAGWFAGIVEAMVRKPTVKDFNGLNDAMSSIKAFYSNKVTKILLIVILANVFSTIATIVSGLDIFNTFLELF